MASVILAIDNIWIFSRLKAVIAGIFELDGCGPQSELQKEVSTTLRRMYPQRFAEVQARYKHPQRFAQVSQVCPTRWGAVGYGADGLHIRRPELALGMVLTFSEGLDENRRDAALSVWSEEGFRHKGLIKMSPKIGRAVYRLNDPGFIFGTCLKAFFHMFVHNVHLTMSSYNKESSSHVMGGVGSLVRRVHYFLIRGMWHVLPLRGHWSRIELREYLNKKIPGVIYTTKNSQDKSGWAMHYPLQWKGLVAAKPRKGILLLNISACIPRENGASLVQDLYGPAYLPEMEGALTRLFETIDSVSKLRCDEPRSVIPKGLMRNLCSGPQDLPEERRSLMVRAVAMHAVHTAKTLEKQLKDVLFDPHMFLGGISDVDKVTVVGTDSQKSTYYVASDVALANAACLTGLKRELEAGYAQQLVDGETLGDFMHGALRDFFLNPNAQRELAEFRKARQVLLDSRWKEDGSYSRAPDKKGPHFRPTPFSAFQTLAKLSLQCAAQPKTNNKVEGGFSLASMAFRCYRRNQGPELNSDTIRKKNAEHLGVIPVVQSKEFIAEFVKELRHRRRHHLLYKKAFSPNAEETEAKYNRRQDEDMPQYVRDGQPWQTNNIEDAPESANVLIRPDRNGGRLQNSRHREAAHDADEIQPDAVRDSTRTAPGRRRPTPPAATSNRWTFESLNREKVNDLKDMCQSQGLVVQSSRGGRPTKPDYVAALLAAEDSHLKSQAQGDSSEPLVATGDTSENGDDVAGAKPSEAAQERGELMEVEEDSGPIESEGGDELIDQGAHAPTAQDVSVGPEVPATAGETDSVEQMLRDFAANGIDPFECDVDSLVKDSDFATFNRAMNADAEGAEDENSDSDSEGTTQSIPSRATRNLLEEVKNRKVSPWKLEYAEALAESSSWKPCKVIGAPTITSNRQAIQSCQLGTPITSVTLEREDDHKQFTVKLKGRVFYLLRTLFGVQMVYLTTIYHPKTGEGNERPVWIEYYRVLRTSDAIQICDRSTTNFQLLEGSDGKSISTSSVGSKELEIEKAEREKQGKPELYHWGDVLCTSNATSLIGAVYWLSRGEERDWEKGTEGKSAVLKAVKDKIPINDLRFMDSVVVGSSFSDSI